MSYVHLKMGMEKPGWPMFELQHNNAMGHLRMTNFLNCRTLKNKTLLANTSLFDAR